MFKFLGKALTGLFLDEQARDALKKNKKAKRKAVRSAGAGGGATRSEREENIARMQKQVGEMVTPERAELLRNAMQVAKAKQKILAHLSDDQRQQLVALAMKQLLNEDVKKKKK
ncbi:MAG: hypothetical protein K2Q10_09520 [Rhodospirillales bacterium]|nr:hypothetical protein [Rhodospirillales bacterium]